MARVSVIVPLFNSATTIVATLQSIVQQTYGDWEIIVGDDGSSDGSADLAAAVSPRIEVVRAGVNRGPATARNLAIEGAEGDLLAFLDSDDLWLPHYLASQVRAYDLALRRQRNVGVVACDAYLEDADGRRLPGTYRDIVSFPRVVTIETLLESNPIFVSALAPTQVVRDVGGFDPRTFGSEDHDLWLKIVERGYVVIDNPVPLAVYRILGSSVSSRPASMARTNKMTYRLALERGLLSPQQRRMARRRLRLQEAVEAVEEFLDGDGTSRSPRALPRFARGLFTFGLFALSHPRRWPRWVCVLARGRLAWRATLRSG
jgi:teichuronic acid biosynthesis glycosyltransferase TuaG